MTAASEITPPRRSVSSWTAVLPPSPEWNTILPSPQRTLSELRTGRSKSQLLRRHDGRYFQPYHSIIDDEEVEQPSVVCVHHHQRLGRVLVRYMPASEWGRIITTDGCEVELGVAGQSTLHVIVPEEMSTLPSKGMRRWLHSAGVNGGSGTAAVERQEEEEPPVFDYFVAPASRLQRQPKRIKLLLSFLTEFRVSTRQSQRDTERIIREDCRAALAVERRGIFLAQLQRDLQNKMARVPLYTIGRELPAELAQLFFLMVDEGVWRQRRESRMRGRGEGDGQRQSTRSGEVDMPASHGTGGPYLFTIDRGSTMLFGRGILFPGQHIVDGYVLVSAGPPLGSTHADRHPFHEETEIDSLSHHVEYGSAEYLPRP